MKTKWRVLGLLIAVAWFSGAAGPRSFAQGKRKAAEAHVPSPKEFLGWTPGDDFKLAAWKDIAGYCKQVAGASPRVRYEEIGKTTLGRPMVAVTISSPENLAKIERYKTIQRKLADPRIIRQEARTALKAEGRSDEETERSLNERVQDEANRLVSEGKTIVLVTYGIHSTEVGGPLASMNVIYRLANADTLGIREILDRCIVLMVPSLNPDGIDIVKQWYDKTLGTPYEGTPPPELYHHYTGHDNNRDWYAFTQVETQLVVEKLHNVWRPQIVHDVHQMGPTAARIFFPPYLDPVEPNVPPRIVQGANFLGTAMAWELTTQGKKGVVISAIYDAWTPARAYQHYHGGVRILSETASARIASPVTIKPEQLRQDRGYHGAQSSVNFVEPWPGGTWKVGDIVEYMQSGVFALLRHAARNRETWLRNFWEISKNAIDAGNDGEVRGYRITGSDAATAKVVNILRRGSVAVTANGLNNTPEKSYLVSLRQPYGAFARALLEPRIYPDLREYPGGPPRAPYDVTAHAIGLLAGARVEPLASMPAVADFDDEGVIDEPAGLAAGITARVALYQSYAASMDEGWTRWVFDQHHLKYATLHDAEARAGNLREKFDCIVIPDQSVSGIAEGLKPKSYPDEFTGGLGEDGIKAIDEFVRQGGTLVAFNRASNFAIGKLNLPVRDVLAGLDRKEFYAPGSILKIELDTQNEVAAGMPRDSIAWFEEGPAFELTTVGDEAKIIGRYPAEKELLLSGWILGAQRIAHKGALVEVKRGKGRIVLFGFRPQYRGQSLATFPLIFNALRLK